jgi:pimeloyl-ACP methyl ester carboxylesterase
LTEFLSQSVLKSMQKVNRSLPEPAPTSAKLTPQERWQRFRKRLPHFSKRQRWTLIGATVLLLFLFGLFVLPYILPLPGPEPRPVEQLADPDGTFIEVDGVKLYYVHQAGEGETVILLHGQGGSTLTWQETIPALHEAGYDVYALDLPGAGLSEKGLDLNYGHPAQADLILGWMNALDIEQAHVVAHAFSGNIAVMLALQYPDRVGKLALAAPTLVTWSLPELPPALFELGFLERWTRVMLQLVMPDAVGEQLRSAAKVDEAITDDVIEDYSRVLHTEDWDLAVIGMVRDSHLNTLPGPLEQLDAPVLLLWGAEDGWAPPENAGGMLAEIPNAKLIEFEGIGHLIMHETPVDFNMALINFLDN